MTMVRNPSGERGSAGALVLVGAACVAASAAVCGLLVAGSVAHTRAEAVADLVAIAGAQALLDEAGPCAAATIAAQRNGAVTVDCQHDGGVVLVEVALPLPPALAAVTPSSDATARAAAEAYWLDADVPESLASTGAG